MTLADVQQRLGRDAADVQADAAEALVALDEDDVEAEIGGAERGGVAAGPEPSTSSWAWLSLFGGCRARPALARRSGASPALQARARRAVAAAASSSSTERRPLGHLVADLHQQLADLARRRAGHLHRRLVGLQDDERLLLGDLLADLDEHLDDGDVGEVADVGNDGPRIRAAPAAGPPARRRGGRRSAPRRRRRSRGGRSSSDSGSISRGTNSAPSQTGFVARAHDAEDRHLRRVDDRREAGAADAAERRDREDGAAASPSARACPRAPCPTARVSSAAISSRPLRSTSRMTGTTRPFGVSAAKPRWRSAFMTSSSPSSERVEARERVERRRRTPSAAARPSSP